MILINANCYLIEYWLEAGPIRNKVTVTVKYKHAKK